VISLPANLFYGTSIPVAVLLLQKGSRKPRRAIYRREQRLLDQAHRSYLRAEDITESLKLLEPLKVSLDSPIAPSLEKSLGKTSNLNVARYVSPCTVPKSSIDELRGEIKALEEDLAVSGASSVPAFKSWGTKASGSCHLPARHRDIAWLR